MEYRQALVVQMFITVVAAVAIVKAATQTIMVVLVVAVRAVQQRLLVLP
jgi:hypothetical protein